MGVSTRILIVDHHTSFRQSLGRYLAMLDASYEIVGEAATDEFALVQVGRLRPDVVLVDIDLPDRNGIATMRCIHASWPLMAVIASSHPDVEYHQQAINAGATSCIDKLTPSINSQSSPGGGTFPGGPRDPVPAASAGANRGDGLGSRY